MPDEGCALCARRDCAILEPQSANVTNNTVVSLIKKVIAMPFNEKLNLERMIIPSSISRLRSVAHFPLK
jgi:hypothetical protein